MKKITEADINAILETGNIFEEADDGDVNQLYDITDKTPEEKLLRLERAVAEHQAFQFIEEGHVDWMDVQSSNVIVKVSQHLMGDKKIQFLSMSLVDMARIAWGCVR